MATVVHCLIFQHFLVCLICLVRLVCLVYLVCLAWNPGRLRDPEAETSSPRTPEIEACSPANLIYQGLNCGSWTNSDPLQDS